MILVGLGTWRGREAVKNILWRAPPASKPQMQPFLTFSQDPTATLSGQREHFRAGREIKGTIMQLIAHGWANWSD